MSKKISEKMYKPFGILIFVAIIIFIAWNKNTADNFRCPNEYKTAKEYVNGTAKWLSEKLKEGPEITQEELLKERERLFYEHNCEKPRWTEDLFN